MNDPKGDSERQYCPRCGEVNHVAGRSIFRCHDCTWMIYWVGPLWGEAKR